VTPRHTPLYREHVSLGAKMVEFGGFEMPLSYQDGTVAEHLACRRGAAAFDVSHLGTVRLEADDAYGRLQANLTNDLARVAPGRAQYSQLLDDADGSVLDDVIVWWVTSRRFDVMPNASNTARVLAALGGVDVTTTRAVIAVQGPRARECVAAVSGEAAAVPRFGVVSCRWSGGDLVVAGTGYTGEDGVELAVPAELAADLWRAVIGAGATPAGLGARDTLRLEAGLPLHGHELGPGMVGWDKGPFRGRAALEAERAAGVPRRLQGLLAGSRRPPRAGDEALLDGSVAGRVTSGNYSPVLERGIALALLRTGVALGERVVVQVRGSELEMTVVKPPFFKLAVASTA
jgi:aminomethyltransferase